MRRLFEELGMDIAGGAYGHFTGEAEWDEFGQVVSIELETAGFDGRPLQLNIGDLVVERIALRKTYGVGFLAETDPAVMDHGKRWFLFQGLSSTLQDTFAEDVADYVGSIRENARARRRSGAA